MQWLTAATCCLIFGTGLMLAFAETAEEARMKLQGTWTAIKAERDGKAADDLVGHRLSFTGKSFQIQSKDGLKGKAWKGIYAQDGDTLTTCDNAPNLEKGRPSAFEAKSGSGYVLITFRRAKS